MSAHTPGPWAWVIDKDDLSEELATLTTDNGSVICDFGNAETYYPTCGVEPNDADMALIAAAPDLLEALIEERRIRLLGQEPDIHWESLRDDRRACYAKTDAAIAKATCEKQ